jgi:D-alanine-D-alanine ligase
VSERKIRVAILYGGRSAEHEVSVVSARSVMAAIDRSKYEVVPIAITKAGRWMLPAKAPEELTAPKGSLPGTGEEGSTVALTREGDAAELQGVGRVDVVFPVLHGPYGEDGTVQGMLELADVPYVGSGVLGSALAMDKSMAKQVLAHHGIAQSRWHGFAEHELTPSTADELVADLGLPVFVKPANMGSSVGVTKAKSREELAQAIDLALSYDERVVVEESIVGREIEVAVLGNEAPRASVPGEIVPGHEFYDYDDKYVDDGARLLVPAPLGEDEQATVRRLALEVFGVLRCEGMARIDFLYEEGGRGFLCNEANTIPGFTPISMYPRLWEASGVPYAKLIDRLIELALERRRP